MLRVINIKNELDAQTEFKNVKTLVKLANDYTTLKEMEEEETTNETPTEELKSFYKELKIY